MVHLPVNVELLAFFHELLRPLHEFLLVNRFLAAGRTEHACRRKDEVVRAGSHHARFLHLNSFFGDVRHGLGEVHVARGGLFEDTFCASRSFLLQFSNTLGDHGGRSRLVAHILFELPVERNPFFLLYAHLTPCLPALLEALQERQADSQKCDRFGE
jgi:hypothetical protein